MRLNISVTEDYWASLGGQTHKRVSERTGGRLSGSKETPNSTCARAEKELFGHVTRHPSELRLANSIIYGRAPGHRGRGVNGHGVNHRRLSGLLRRES